MKKVLVILLIVLFISTTSHAAVSIALIDDTLVSDKSALRGLASNKQKALVITGAVGDNIDLIEDGVTVRTITLAAASEKWVFDHVVHTFKVDWDGSNTVTLIIAE